VLVAGGKVVFGVCGRAMVLAAHMLPPDQLKPFLSEAASSAPLLKPCLPT
jgi:hypothetical protein